VVLLILESLGSTELVFILIMALVFFGPRKLPQLSRTLGKNLASFRRASEDFKRTWDREVTLDELNLTKLEPDLPRSFGENSILDNAQVGQPLQAPTIEAVPAERIIPRGTAGEDMVSSSEMTDAYDHSAHSPKREWL
jgi:sec-independent protein translocase protein TatB